MTGSSSKLLQIQGKWYQERKLKTNPKHSKTWGKRNTNNYSMPFYTPFWPQIILLPQVGGEAPTGSEELSHGTIGVSHAMSNSLFFVELSPLFMWEKHGKNNHQPHLGMVYTYYTTHLSWFWGWFMIVLPALNSFTISIWIIFPRSCSSGAPGTPSAGTHSWE